MAARLVAPKLSQRMGQQFYVENIPGGASNIGTGQVARAKPDGHTLLCTAPVFVMNPIFSEKTPYSPEHDFEPVTLLCTTPVVLTVNPNVQAQRVEELAALIKRNPRSFSYASPGVGTPPHLVGEMFRMSLGLDLPHIPYKCGGEALAATLAGHTPLCFGALGVAAPQIKAGTVRAIVVASTQRSPSLPAISTMQEAGYPEIVGEVWAGLLAPAQTPNEIVTALYRNVKLTLAALDLKDRFVGLGFDVVGSAPNDFRFQIAAELARYKKVVQASGIKPS
jgi:tripartite-type tricarboxylate transporter receptor subunit TctC